MTTDHDDLTPEPLPPALRRALDALPRERAPSDLLEERTVRALRARGLLDAERPAGPAAPTVPAAEGVLLGEPVPARRVVRPTPAARRRLALWVTGAAAAAVALFASGVAVGQWVGARSAEQTLLAVREQDAQLDALRAATVVQRTGSAYVAALASLSAATDSAGAEERTQAREVALTLLRSAASEIVRLAPNDPVAANILRGLDQGRDAAPPAEQRQVIWF